jgi:hypothetical protein
VPIWQLFAGVLALALIVMGAVVLRTSRRPSRVVFVLQVVPIPAAGFLYFVLQAGAGPELTLLTWISTFLVVFGLFPAFYSRRALQDWRSTVVTPAHVTFVNRHVLAARICLVLGASGYVFMFEPWFGIANLAGNALWVAMWIPKRWRAKTYEVSAEVRHSPERVLHVLFDPSYWMRYQVDLEAVTAYPAGPLAVGSEFTTRRTFSGSSTEASTLTGSSETRYRVTAMTASALTTVILDGGGTVTTEVERAGPAARVTARAGWRVSVVSAILGQALETKAAIASRREVSLRSYQKLDDLLRDLPPTD